MRKLAFFLRKGNYAQRGKVTCPQSHSALAAGPER